MIEEMHPFFKMYCRSTLFATPVCSFVGGVSGWDTAADTTRMERMKAGIKGCVLGAITGCIWPLLLTHMWMTKQNRS